MGYASLSGRARTDASNPKAFAVCDRCGMWYNHCDLRWQMDYRGRSLANLRILVCESCYDDPQPQLKPRIIPPDPVSIKNARIEPFTYDQSDDRQTTNPALFPVDVGTTTNVQLSGLQFIDGVQLQTGALVLVMAQTLSQQNGIYRAETGAWTRMGYDSARQQYVTAESLGATYLIQLGLYLGAVYVSHGTYSARLFQISFDPAGVIDVDGVTIESVVASTVCRYDFFTGLYCRSADTRITEDDDIRVTQMVGAAPGSLNEVPGISFLVPGEPQIGTPTEAPYPSATRQGLPPGFITLPYAGPLWPNLSAQGIQYWLTDDGAPAIWQNNSGITVTFSALGFWPTPGPGAPWRPTAYGLRPSDWLNAFEEAVAWANVLAETVLWNSPNPIVVLPPGGEVLWTDDNANLILWHNESGSNVDFAQIYPNAVPPNKPTFYPWIGS